MRPFYVVGYRPGSLEGSIELVGPLKARGERDSERMAAALGRSGCHFAWRFTSRPDLAELVVHIEAGGLIGELEAVDLLYDMRGN